MPDGCLPARLERHLRGCAASPAHNLFSCLSLHFQLNPSLCEVLQISDKHGHFARCHLTITESGFSCKWSNVTTLSWQEAFHQTTSSSAPPELRQPAHVPEPLRWLDCSYTRDSAKAFSDDETLYSTKGSALLCVLGCAPLDSTDGVMCDPVAA